MATVDSDSIPIPIPTPTPRVAPNRPAVRGKPKPCLLGVVDYWFLGAFESWRFLFSGAIAKQAAAVLAQRHERPIVPVVVVFEIEDAWEACPSPLILFPCPFRSLMVE